jgi:hypothetical protein
MSDYLAGPADGSDILIVENNVGPRDQIDATVHQDGRLSEAGH